MLALHAPDGFLDAPVAVGAGLISLAVIAAAVRASGRELGERQVPLAGLAAAFVFAAQMINFPVASGTTGHLLGACLAAVLLGPWVGSLAVSVVIIVQAFLFADGGVTALGYNLLNMAIVPAFGGWALYRAFRRLLPGTAAGVVGATGLAAGASVVLSAMALSLEWLFGATAPVPFDTVFGAMVGVHALIGIGEGVISGVVIGSVLASRPDLVAGAGDLVSGAGGLVAGAGGRDVGALTDRGPMDWRVFVIAGVLFSVVVAAVVSQFAADDPDGLERVAVDEGLVEEEGGDHPLAAAPFADYATRGIDHEGVSLAVAGVAGVAVTLSVGGGLASASRRLRSADRPAAIRPVAGTS